MILIKYILIIYTIISFNFTASHADSYCQGITTKSYVKKLFSNECLKNPKSLWECLLHKKEPTFWEKCQSALECFSWEAFEDTDDFITLPFEYIIDGFEFFLSDFIDFYIEYVSNILTAIWKMRIVHFIINPATIFGFAMYIFQKKMFTPLLQHLQSELEMEDEIYPEETLKTSCDEESDSTDIYIERDIED